MTRRNPESGYALLLVYAMAAAVAIMLYMQLPRAAFEAQRDKEQLLVDRGEQYSRAVQLYVRKFNRFPADIAALENTQNQRFLRRQYVDPMTGKSEWRLIHVGPGGIFTDSLVHKPKKDLGTPQTFITEMQQVGGNQTVGGQEGVNLANRRRPSDGPGAPGNPGASATDPGAASNPGPGGISGPVMVLPDGRIVPATTTGYPPPPAPGQPGVPGQTRGIGQPGIPGQLGIPGQFFPGGVSPGGVGTNGLPNGLPNGFQTQPNGGPPPGAANLINQILTTPRPGGLNGLGQPTPIQGSDPSSSPANGTVPNQGLSGTTIGGGLAGVASKLEQEGIKLYNERSAYNEWEFVYDMTKDPMRVGGGQAVAQPATPQPGSPAQQAPPVPPISVK